MNCAHPPIVFLAAAALALPLAAQTPTAAAKASSSTTGAHSATTATHAVRCATPAPVTPQNIPALPASAPCAKSLYTLTTTSPTRLDYASPLLSDDVRKALVGGSMTYSLNYVDTVAGSGARVEAGKYVTVKYAGYLGKEGTKFDDSDDHPNKEPITIQYGMHNVIEGWDTGFEGMRVGGKRRIFIPWELAYGERGRPPRIPAKADLIFDVEVVSQSDKPPTPPAPTARPMPPGMHPGAPPAGAPTHPTTVTPQPPAAGAPGTTPPAGTTTPQGSSTTTPQAGTASPQSGSAATPPAGTPNPQASTTQPNQPQ
jgi:peptidylprolyl isomerase